MVSSERLHSKAFLLKTKKVFKHQKEILACRFKIGNTQGQSSCRSPILQTLPCNYIKSGLHHWHFAWNCPTFQRNYFTEVPVNDWLESALICLVCQIIIAWGEEMLKCNRRSAVIAFRILLKSHKGLYQNSMENISHAVLLL